MSERVELQVTMELLSDAIFGSGYSIPGGEDIAVVRNNDGYPYIPGTAVKGLLRESMENWIAWTDGNPSDISEILGESGWSGDTDGRRLALTPFALEERPSAAEDCFGYRVFTALEDGVVKTDTLRTAACIGKGLRFVGTMVCAEKDITLLVNALAGIKWAGAQRSRGFGRVHFHAERVNREAKTVTMTSGGCIRYHLRTETPVIIMDLNRSAGNSYETQGYISGAAMRGAVMSELSMREPEWFEANKAALLSDHTRFLDALPKVAKLDVLPSIKGFYENKEETAFESVVQDGSFTPGFKRAKLGTFCGLEGGTVCYWSAGTGGTTRIRRSVKAGENSLPFKTRYLNDGQEFEGYILLDDAKLAPKITEAISGTVWIGSDRFEGYGKCSVTCEMAKAPGWIDAYGYQRQTDVGKELYLLALSPLVMLDNLGNPVGLDLAKLAKRLEVGTIELQFCSTSTSKYDAYNRTWQCREPALPMYDRGSIFKLICDRPPQLSNIHAIERTGLGVRVAQGFGQVLFLRKELFEGLHRKKQAIRAEAAGTKANAAQVRRAKYTWIMKHSDLLRQDGLSKSQLGAIQALCEKAISKGGDTSELDGFLEKNKSERGAKHGSRFQKIAELIREVTGQPLAATIGENCEDSMTKRLDLLCQLFNYSRKGKEAG